MVKDEIVIGGRSRPHRPTTSNRSGPVRATAAQSGNQQFTKPAPASNNTAKVVRNGSAPPTTRSNGTLVNKSAPRRAKQSPDRRPAAFRSASQKGKLQRTPPPTPVENELPTGRAVSDVLDSERPSETPESAHSPPRDEPVRAGSPSKLVERDPEQELVKDKLASRSPSRSPKRELAGKLDESAQYGPIKGDDELPSKRFVPVQAETDELNRLLVDAEVDAQAVDIQLGALKDALLHMRNERFLTSTEWNVVNSIRENCISKLSAFERSSHALRLSIRGRQRIELSAARIAEQRDVLADRVGLAESRLEATRIACAEKDEVIDALKHQVNRLSDELDTVERLRDHAEDTRAHLQKQYRLKEAECDRLAVQIRDMHAYVNGSGGEIDKHRKMYEELAATVLADKEQLKKATKAYKEKSGRLEHQLEMAADELKQRDALLGDLQSQLTDTRVKCDQLLQEAAQQVSELASTRKRCEELETELDKRNNQLDAAMHRELDAKSEASKVNNEGETLRERLTQAEARIADLQGELEAGRSKLASAEQSVAEHERRVAAYQRELRESATENAKLSRSLKAAERDREREHDRASPDLPFGSTFETADPQDDPPRRVRSESVDTSRPSRADAEARHLRTSSVDGVRPRPTSSQESLMLDANQRVAAANQRVREREAAFFDAQARTEDLAAQNAVLRERLRVAHDETKALESRVSELEKRLAEGDSREADLRNALSRSETDRLTRTSAVDEVRRENAALAKQLEHALGEARRVGDLAKDKFAIRERTLQQRVSDLEKQVAALRTDNARARRDKDELERRLVSENRDLRDRYEQTQQTNRALQNYVGFLKHSAAQQSGVDEYRAALAADSGARLSAVPSLFSGNEFGKQFGLASDPQRPPSASFGRFDPLSSQPQPFSVSGKSDLL